MSSNQRKPLTIIAAVLFDLTLITLLGAILAGDINPANWTDQGRLILVFSWIFSLVPTVALASELSE